MELAILLLRTLFFYFLIMFTMLVFTKQRKMTLADLLIILMISQFAVLSIDKPGKPLLAILLPTLLLLVLHLAVNPILRKKWRRQRSVGDNMNKDDRTVLNIPKFYPRPADVEMAMLENTVEYPSVGQLPLPLILDGKVIDHNLDKLGKTRFWLKNEVQRYNVAKFKEIAYCSVDRFGHLYLDKKKNH